LEVGFEIVYNLPQRIEKPALPKPEIWRGVQDDQKPVAELSAQYKGVLRKAVSGRKKNEERTGRYSGPPLGRF
jgi:hypothetical protein